jgi:flavin-dependent dehydrogenase
LVRELAKYTPWDSPPLLSEADCLNTQNVNGTKLPSSSDVVVVGGGIHSLIYAIHARLKSLYNLEHGSVPSGQGKPVSITVLEKSQSPGYKIGESTLTTFGVWLKSVGISTALLWRLFGPKDGLAFYYLPHNGDRDGYTDFCANGPAGDFVATLQIERKISELLLTLFAQRLGVHILHGHTVDIDSTRLPSNIEDDSGPSGRVHVSRGSNGKTTAHIDTKLVVDATGRFRRFASKVAKTERLGPFNTDSFWAYFEMVGDESDIPLRHYESCHTNHICIAEG